MIWIRITFNNFMNWKSLPQSFSIKRQWNRYDDSYQQVISDNIRSDVASRFLNKICFHYVPAIRSREIFSHYLSLLHDALIDDERAGIRQSSEALIGEINRSTTYMSRQILDLLSITSAIQPPSDLKNLFRSLDFSTEHGNHKIPLIKRGDGIQAHHIPFILDFLSIKSTQYNIWGYEEPENSMELGRAFELSNHFENIFSRSNQIFLTTHSPAFYSIGNNSKKWIIEKNISSDGEWDSTFSLLNENTEADSKLGVAWLIKDRLKEMHAKVSALNMEIEAINKKLTDANKNLLIVEGESDKAIFQKIQELRNGNIQIESAGGAEPLGSLMAGIKKSGVSPKKIVAIVDGDHAGLAAIRNCKADVDGCVLENQAYIFSTQYSPIQNEILINVEIKNLSWGIEHFLPTHIIQEAIAIGTIAFADITKKFENLEYNTTDVLIKDKEHIDRYMFQAVTDQSKMNFARWLIEKNDIDAFGALVQIYDHAYEILSDQEG